jgi:hypothetical protein
MPREGLKRSSRVQSISQPKKQSIYSRIQSFGDGVSSRAGKENNKYDLDIVTPQGELPFAVRPSISSACYILFFPISRRGRADQRLSIRKDDYTA